MYPHERSLVKKLADHPFALVGINSDRDKDVLRKRLEEENITWRSFFQGSTDGPISTQWNIRGWPTLFLIDAKGVIRNKWLGSPSTEELDKLIDELLAEAEAAK